VAARPKGSCKTYNWHPLVHKQHFGERLYFVMVRLKDPLHVPVAEQVRGLLKAAGVKYACEYTLFGWHDALIRAWLKPTAYERLMSVLPKEVQGFTVERIHYLWHDARDLLKPNRQVLSKINGAKAVIDSVAQNPADTDSTDWQTLSGDDLKLVFARPTGADGVKFYTALKSTDDRVSPDDQVKAILKALRKTHVPRVNSSMAANASLYCGAGKLGDYLVRCVAPTYVDVLPLVEEFDINLKEAQVRPMTLLVANPRPLEHDHPNDPVHLSPDDDNLAEILSINRRALAELDDHYCVELRKLVQDADNAAGNDTRLRKLLRGMFRATVTSNKDAWYQSIIFLAEFEPLFGKRVEGILALELGDTEWFATIKEECTQSSNKVRRETGEIMAKKKKAFWDLGNYKFVALAAAEFHPNTVGARLDKELGDGWAAEVESIQGLRNVHLHGRKYEQPLNAYDEAWTRELRRLIDAASLWRRCMRDDSRRKKKPA
jgi:hypothetical protein